LEDNKCKSRHMDGLRSERVHFAKMNELVLGTSQPSFCFDFIGEDLKQDYDTTTFDQFKEMILSAQEGIVSASFHGHKFFNDNLIGSIDLPSLLVLSLRHTKVTDQGIANLIKVCPQLRALDIVHTSIRGEGLKLISKYCPLLEYIEVCLPLDISILLPFCVPLEHLKTICGIETYDVNDKDIENLTAIPSVTRCTIKYNSKISERGLHLLRTKPTFERSYFPAETLLRTASPDGLLCFKPHGKVNLETFQKCVFESPHLINIDIGLQMCERIDDMLEALAKSRCASSLLQLSLHGQEGITDRGFQYLKYLTGLRTLNLHNVIVTKGNYRNIHEKAVIEASSGWSNLMELILDFCPITAETLAMVVQNTPKLQVLSINGCDGGHGDVLLMAFDLRKYSILWRQGLKVCHGKF